MQPGGFSDMPIEQIHNQMMDRQKSMFADMQMMQGRMINGFGGSMFDDHFQDFGFGDSMFKQAD